MNATTERLPGYGWRRLPPVLSTPGLHSQWTDGQLIVVSSLVDAEMPDGNGDGPQWHVSVSAMGKRPSEREVRRALRAFGMSGAEEDNHHPGVARQFWRPLDHARRVDCACKESETTIVEPDGFRWTNPKDGPCRGCELEKLLGRACGVHRRTA